MESTINARSRSQTLVQAVKNNDIARVEELLNTVTSGDIRVTDPLVFDRFENHNVFSEIFRHMTKKCKFFEACS